MSKANPDLQDHVFLEAVEADDLWPKAALNRGRRLMERLCTKLDALEDATVDEFYELTNALTEDFNAMAATGLSFDATVWENIASDLETVAAAYGIDDADMDEALSAREW